jgi:hypothetical protein
LVANGANNRNGIKVRLEAVQEAANHGLFVARNYAEMYFCHAKKRKGHGEWNRDPLGRNPK